MDPALALLRGSVNDLKKFKVLGTIDNVILVLDKSTEETFVIKVGRQHKIFTFSKQAFKESLEFCNRS